MPTLADMGERRAVKELLRVFDRGHCPGLGDDCAIIPFGDNYLLVTTDVANAKTHFPEGATGYDMGWYAVAMNLSDIAAMGGQPLGFVSAITLPRSTDLSLLLEIAKGMDDCTKRFGVSVCGGDTKEGDILSISGMAIGRVSKDRILLRSGCKPDDILVVTGDIGRGGCAIEAMRRNGPSRETIEPLLHILPRLDQGMTLASSDSVTSCMDSSDGLASTLHQLIAASNVGFEVEERWLPVHPRLRAMQGVNLRTIALYSGGDYELVATVRPEKLDTVQSAFARKNFKLTVIGRATTKKECILLTLKGKEPIENKGWEHFRN